MDPVAGSPRSSVSDAAASSAGNPLTQRVQRAASEAVRYLGRTSACTYSLLRRAAPVIVADWQTYALVGVMTGVLGWDLPSAHLFAGSMQMGAGLLLRDPGTVLRGGVHGLSSSVDFALQAMGASTATRISGLLGTPILAAGALLSFVEHHLGLGDRSKRLTKSLPGDERAGELRFLIAWAIGKQLKHATFRGVPPGPTAFVLAREQLFAEAPHATEGAVLDKGKAGIAPVMEKVGQLVLRGSRDREMLQRELPFPVISQEEWDAEIDKIERGTSDFTLGSVVMVVGEKPSQWRLFQVRADFRQSEEEWTVAELDVDQTKALEHKHILPPRLQGYLSLSGLSGFCVLTGFCSYSMSLEGNFVNGYPQGLFHFYSDKGVGQGQLTNQGWVGPFQMKTSEPGGASSWWIGTVTDGTFEGWHLTEEAVARFVRCPMGSCPSHKHLREIGPWFSNVKRGQSVKSQPMTREEVAWVALTKLALANGMIPVLLPPDLDECFQNPACGRWEQIWTILESSGIAKTREFKDLPPIWQGLLAGSTRPSTQSIRQEVARAEKQIRQRILAEQREAARASAHPCRDFFRDAQTGQERLALLVAQRREEATGSSSAPLAAEILAQVWEDLASVSPEALEEDALLALGEWLDAQLPPPPSESLPWRRPEVLSLLQARSAGISRWVRWCVQGGQWNWMNQHLAATEEDLAWILQEIRRGATPPLEFFSELQALLANRPHLLAAHRSEAGLLAPELRRLWRCGLRMQPVEAQALIQDRALRSALEDWERLVKGWNQECWQELLVLMEREALSEFLAECSIRTARMLTDRFAFLPLPKATRHSPIGNESGSRADDDSSNSSSPASSRCSTPATAAAASGSAAAVPELHVLRDVVEQIGELSPLEAAAVRRWLSDAEDGLITGERPQVVQGAASVQMRTVWRNWLHAHINAPGGSMFVIFYRTDSQGRRVVEGLMRGHDYDRDFDPRRREQIILRSQNADQFVRFADSR
jgi:hypothetical protein